MPLPPGPIPPSQQTIVRTHHQNTFPMGGSTTSPVQNGTFKADNQKLNNIAVTTNTDQAIPFSLNTKPTGTKSNVSLPNPNSDFTITSSTSTTADNKDEIDLGHDIDDCWACGAGLEFTGAPDSGLECFDCGLPN